MRVGVCAIFKVFWGIHEPFYDQVNRNSCNVRSRDRMMQLFKFEVKPDWQEFDRRRTREYVQLWRSLQGLVIGSTALMILLSALPLPWQLEFTLRTILSFVLFLSFPLWIVYQSQTSNLWRVVVVFMLLVGASLIAGYTFAWPPESRVSDAGFHLSLPVAILIPVISWGILTWSYRRFPTQMRRLGFFPEQWTINVLIGFMAGSIIGFHFLISTLLLTGRGGPLISISPQMLWTFLFQIGLAALGEEFLLRGLGFQLLYEEEQNNFWSVAVRLALLDLLIYIVPMFHSTWSMLWVWVLLYQVVFSFIVTFLRYRQGSLIACIMCSVIFHTLLATVALW